MKQPTSRAPAARPVEYQAPAVIPAGASPAPASRALSAPMPEFRELIAARAYHLWVEAGRPEGRDQDYWFTAERDMRALPGAPPRS